MEDPTYLTAAEAAAALGVKLETIYAYVSRGLIRSERTRSAPGAAAGAATGVPTCCA